jgi:DNA primase
MVHLPRISRDQLDAIKSRVDLAAIVSERGIKLQRKGRHLFALCPFHSEKTPSFVVTPHRGLFHCFGCGLGGDAIGFLVRYDRVSFPEAVRMLAARAGVDLEASDPRREGLCGRTSWR